MKYVSQRFLLNNGGRKYEKNKGFQAHPAL